MALIKSGREQTPSAQTIVSPAQTQPDKTREAEALARHAESTAATAVTETPEVKTAEAKPADGKVKPAEIELDFLKSGGLMLSPQLAATTAPVRSRSDKQQVMDRKVKELHETWIKAEKPSTWEKMVAAQTVATYFVEPQKSAELHSLISRAVTFTGLRARFGTSFKATAKLVADHGLPEAYVGREVISFAIMDKRPRGTSKGKPAAEIISEKTAS